MTNSPTIDKIRFGGKLFDRQRFPYIRLSVAVARQVNPDDLTVKTWNGIDWPATDIGEATISGFSHVKLGTKDGYNREVASAYASILPGPDGIADLDTMELTCPNLDSIGGYGAVCLLPPA